MIYRLLGELEIGEGSRLLHLPGGPTLVVLAALLVNANRRMSKTELIRAAWGGDDVEEAQLYKRVKAVRDLLAEMGHGDHLKTHPRFGYEMRVAEDDVDALMFQRLVLEADEAGAEQRTEDEIGHLRHALRLWRGLHPLSNVPSDAFRQEVVALEQRHKRAAVRLFDLDLARGQHERILGELMLIAGCYPADRRLCEQLMLAEYRCGHLADVAGAYDVTGKRWRRKPASRTPLPACTSRSPRGRRGSGRVERLAERTRTPSRPVSLPQLPPPPISSRGDLAAEVRGCSVANPGRRPGRGDLRARGSGRRRWRCAPRTPRRPVPRWAAFDAAVDWQRLRLLCRGGMAGLTTGPAFISLTTALQGAGRVTLIGRRRQPLTGSEKAGNGSREISCRGGRTLAGRQ